MFSHVMLGATDIEKSKIFYDETLGVLGARPGKLTLGHDERKRYIYFIDYKNSFLITEPINDQDASHGNGATIGFYARANKQHNEAALRQLWWTCMSALFVSVA